MKLTDALIGFSGFVGNTLLKQTPFEALYRSTNTSDIDGQSSIPLSVQARPLRNGLPTESPRQTATISKA